MGFFSGRPQETDGGKSLGSSHANSNCNCCSGLGTKAAWRKSDSKEADRLPIEVKPCNDRSHGKGAPPA